MDLMSWVIVCFVAIAVIFVLIARMERRPDGSSENFIKKPSVMTANELKMYWVLIEAFPPTMWIVLAEVSFNKLIEGGTRSKFNTYVADFVLCKKSGETVCVIELDDETHRRKKVAERDAKKMRMFETAGLPVVRFEKVPTALDAFRKTRKIAMLKAG